MKVLHKVMSVVTPHQELISVHVDSTGSRTLPAHTNELQYIAVVNVTKFNTKTPAVMNLFLESWYVLYKKKNCPQNLMCAEPSK